LLCWLTGDGLTAFYAHRLQSPLFTAFLTLGGFLLALQTQILMRLKSDLYDTDFYKDRVRKLNHLADPNKKLTVYGPLKRLGSFLIISVLLTLGAAVTQMTIGFIPHKLAAAFCIGSAAAAITIVFLAWYEMRKNLDHWFEMLEEQAEKQAEQNLPDIKKAK